MTFASSGESGEPGASSSLGCRDPVGHDARFQVASDQAQYLLVDHPSSDPRHQGVVSDPVEERVEIDVDHPRRAICDGLACSLDRLVGRAPRPKAEGAVVEVRVEDGRQHLQ
jgi:hypothetical protein